MRARLAEAAAVEINLRRVLYIQLWRGWCCFIGTEKRVYVIESVTRENEEMDVVTMNVVPPQLPASQLATAHQVLLVDTSAEDQEIKAPKKRAETWAQDEIKALIAYRKEMDGMFNTSKSNKHLWEQISLKMKEQGYDRSPTMCTDKWRNLLKEYKKAKVQDKGTSKVACFKDLEELLSDRTKSVPYRSPAKLDALQHSPKGGDRQLSGRKVVIVKFGDMIRRICVDGPFESIKESIKTSFGLRTKRPFWLEDDEGVIQPLSRDMPAGQYSINLDPGFTVKVCLYDESGRMTGSTENRTLYTDEDFHEFLSRRGWSGLREVGTFRDFDSLEELRPGAVYQHAP